MLWVASFAPFDQLWVFVHDDEGVLDRDRRHLDAKHFGGALRVVTRSGHDMLGGDDDLLVRRDQVAALFDHLGAGDFPSRPVPVERIRLPFALDHHAALTGTFGHRLSDISGVNVAIFGVVDRAFQVVCLDQRPTLADLLWREPFVFHAASLGSGGIEHIFVHTLLRLRHAQVANHGEACVQAGFFFQCLVEIDRILVNMGGRIAHVEKRQQTSGVPGRARGQLVTFQQHHVFPARFREVVGNRGSDGATADDKRFDIGFHLATTPGQNNLSAMCMRRDFPVKASRPFHDEFRHRPRFAV